MCGGAILDQKLMKHSHNDENRSLPACQQNQNLKR